MCRFTDSPASWKADRNSDAEILLLLSASWFLNTELHFRIRFHRLVNSSSPNLPDRSSSSNATIERHESSEKPSKWNSRIEWTRFVNKFDFHSKSWLDYHYHWKLCLLWQHWNRNIWKVSHVRLSSCFSIDRLINLESIWFTFFKCVVKNLLQFSGINFHIFASNFGEEFAGGSVRRQFSRWCFIGCWFLQKELMTIELVEHDFLNWPVTQNDHKKVETN